METVLVKAKPPAASMAVFSVSKNKTKSVEEERRQREYEKYMVKCIEVKKYKLRKRLEGTQLT